MSNHRFTIWCNSDFDATHSAELEQLRQGVVNHELLLYEASLDGQHGEANEALHRADIVFGFPDVRTAVECQKLRWIQLITAGYTSFDHAWIKKALKERQVMLTNSSAVYAEPCAQHVMAMILALARGLPDALSDQRGQRSWPMSRLRPQLQLLNEQTVVILGFGAIAKRLAQLLRPFEVNLIMVRREIKGDELLKVVKVSQLEEFLPLADHVVNTLPANDASRNFLNAERLALMKRGAIIYNIGRGTTLDQNALMKELRVGRLSAAYLDVTEPEPLPPDHPLWETPNCFITPHIGGGHRREKERQVKHFLENLRRFERGEELQNRIF